MTADDLTPGTPRPARVGDTVHTAAELDALPDHTILRTARGYPTELVSDKWSGNRCLSSTIETGGDGWWSLGTAVAKMAPLTVLFRPDAPQPAATGNSAFPVADDAVERAARAVARVMGANGFVMPPESARPIARAALAAAGAGTEVDREALAARLADEVEYRVRTAVALAKGGHPIDGEVTAGRARVVALLAARGDATTPTEVEWAIRFGPGSHPISFDEDGSALTEEGARQEVRENAGAALMQRDVHRSAWREVEGGEQRG